MTRARNLIGYTFGRLRVISRVKSVLPKSRWECQCECGGATSAYAQDLLRGDVTSCGCNCLDVGKDYLGSKIGLLTVIDKVYTNGRNKWRCICDCGNIKYLGSKDLDGKRYNSCGCKAGEIRIPLLDRVIRSRYKAYKQNCKIKNREFRLSESEFQLLVTSPCHYCGQIDEKNVPKRIGKGGLLKPKQRVNGVDRLNSSVGYIKSNVVPCCYMCNKMKMEFPLTEWLGRIRLIAERFKL